MPPSAEPSPGLKGDKPAAASPQGLVDRRELAFIAVERTLMSMVVTDPRQADNPIVLANRAFLALSGYTADEVIGRNCRFLQGPDTGRAAIQELRDAMVNQRDISVELLNYRKDGSAFWNQVHLSPIHDDAGRLIYFFGSQQDVSDRRRAQDLEAAEHRLLKEVDHRTMNALAVVDGIVRLSRAETVSDYAAAVQGRVHVLARTHRLLASRGWIGVPLSVLLRLQLEPLGLDRVRLSGPPVDLPAPIVQPLALVFHELAANTVEHGSLSASTGLLDVEWFPPEADGRVALRWKESGGPRPQPPHRRGFGAIMIEAILERQLQGGMQRRWETGGLEADIRIPVTTPDEAVLPVL